MQSLLTGELRAAIRADIDAESTDPHERLLSEQLDRLRDAAKDGPPATNLPLFKAFLEALPAGASGVIRFRAKANIGLQHLQRGDHAESARWLLEAFQEAPADPRAIANKALALWLKSEFETAYRYGRDQIAADPTNQALAGYLPQFAAAIPSVSDDLEGVPEALRATEPVILAHIQFLRVRDIRPDWWVAVRDGAPRFPDSKTLKVLAAVADVDEIARNERFQRKQMLTTAQRSTLQQAVSILDSDWESKHWLLSNPYDDALNIFAAAMVAHYFLRDTKRTLELIDHLAGASVSNPGVLVDAANMAHSLGEVALAKRIIACAPDEPTLMFPAATIAMEEGDWDTAATLYGKATIPETEQHVTQTVLKLAPLVQAKKRGLLDTDPTPALKEIFKAAGSSPRSLVLVANVATKLGSRRLAQRAFKAAVDAVNEESHIATRLMVAAYAERVHSSAGVIRLLDGHLPSEGFERDYERLAVAHANERPHRKRNLAFFQGLPPEILHRREIARAHANVLLNVGLLPDAIPLLRRLHSDDPTDTFITLRLLEALQRSGDKAGFSAVVRNLNLATTKGQPAHIMQLAALLAREGKTERAYAAAYDLVRKNRNDPDVAMGYLGLGLLSEDPTFGPDPTTVQVGTSVSLKGPGNARRTYVIDEGEDFFSVQVIPPNNPMARRLIGKAKGDFVELLKMGLEQPERWTVEEIASKYGHLHRQIIENFETRFPGQQGISSFSVENGDVETVFDIVRRRSERNQGLARAYIEKDLPLAFVARMVGGDVASFAAFVRNLGGDIITCRGSSEERLEAIGRAQQSRGSGAVLDPYTAWVASELGVLPDLKKWFGTLATPSSTIDFIDRLIEQERDGLGKSQLSVSWHNGQFFRHEVDDSDRVGQIDRLSNLRADIVEHVDVQAVLIPDDVPSDVTRTLRMAGSRFFDAGFLAAERDAPLLSDDLRYREFCSAMLGTKGMWLQAAFQASIESGSIAPEKYARAVVGLAARRHGHVALTGPILFLIASNDDELLSNLRIVLTRLGGPKAEITSHLVVLREFLHLLWVQGRGLPLLTMQAATSAALEAIVSGRKHDAHDIMRSALWQVPQTRASRDHIRAWRRGHFISRDRFSANERSG